MGARIERPVTREIVSYWVEATLDGEIWSVTLEAPVEAGEYLWVWRTGDPEPPEYETFIPLTVYAAGVEPVVDFALVTPEMITPTVEEVAILERTRTASGGGGDIEEFTESTRPTASEVEELIEQAVFAVLTQIGEPRFSEAHFQSARHAVCLYTALLIETSFFREQSDQGAADTWRTLFNQSMVNMQNRIDEELTQQRLLKRIEYPVPTTELA